VAQDSCDATISKARLDLKTAEASQRAASDQRLTNADMRKASVDTDPGVIGAKRDYIYFKGRLSVQEDRKKKISKCMDRIGRELWFRTQNDSEPDGEFFRHKGAERSIRPGGFKRRGS